MSSESRRATDSTSEPMDDVLPVRMRHEMRLESGRMARINGFDNLSEYIRWLLRREIDLHMANTLHDDDGNLVLRTRGASGGR